MKPNILMPAGYIAIADCPALITKLWSDDSFGLDTRTIDDAINELTALFGGEILKVYGWDFNGGEIISIPSKLFRADNGIEKIKRKIAFSIFNEASDDFIDVILIIDSDEIIGQFGGYFHSKKYIFDLTDWELTSSIKLSKYKDKNTLDSQEYKIEKRGRRPTHDWEKFFQEAILFADLNNIEERGDTKFFEDHMKDWVAKNMGPKPPHRTQIAHKLRPILDGVRNRNRSIP